MSATQFLHGEPTARRILAFLVPGLIIIAAAVIVKVSTASDTPLPALLIVFAISWLLFGGLLFLHGGDDS